MLRGTSEPSFKPEEQRDRTGRRCSGRSVKTGPGSRGGHFHDPEWRRQWYRDYNRAHPEYRERDNERRRQRRRQRQWLAEIHDGGFAFTDVLMSLAVAHIEQSNISAFSREIGVEQTTIRNLFRRGEYPRGDTINAMVTYFGISAITRHWSALRLAVKASDMPPGLNQNLGDPSGHGPVPS